MEKVFVVINMRRKLINKGLGNLLSLFQSSTFNIFKLK